MIAYVQKDETTITTSLFYKLVISIVGMGQGVERKSIKCYD